MSSENAQYWQLAGIQHVIFMRIFPSLRHGLVGPISIARMSTSIVRKLLTKEGQPGIAEQVARIDQQLQEAVLAIRALQSWEPAANELANPLDLIQQGLQIMTTPFAMSQIEVSLADDWASSLPTTPVAQRAFLYAWLGVLCYCQDSIKGQAVLSITASLPQANPGLVITLPEAVTTDAPAINGPGLLINQEALHILALHAGWRMQYGHRQLSFTWA